MAITVVGSVAFDTVETPAGRRERCLAGAATYFSLAASFFTDVRVIAVVGEDFGASEQAVFDARKIDTTGIQHRPGKSFFWQGSYMDNLNEAKTINTELNVFAGFEPSIPASYGDSEYLFLANIDPVLQRRVREAMPQAKLVGGDTMNYWIKDHKPALLEVLKGLDVLLINDTETRMLTGARSIALAAGKIFELGPKILVVKHGEYGATAFFARSHSARSGALRLRSPASITTRQSGDVAAMSASTAGAKLRLPALTQTARRPPNSGMVLASSTRRVGSPASSSPSSRAS